MSGEPTRAVIVLTALLFVLASPAGATIEIGFTDDNEERPAVVFNSVNGEYLVAWRETIEASGVMVQRVSTAGAVLGLPITVLVPGAPALATGRPALAYSPVSNSYVIAVNRYAGPGVDDNFLHVSTLDGATATETEAYNLFVDSEFHDPISNFQAGPVRLTYNPIDEEFLASYQRTVVVDEGLGTKHNIISTQRYRVGSGPYGIEQDPISAGLFDINSHDVEVSTYIQESNPPDPPVIGARYLVAYGGATSLNSISRSST